MKKVYIGAALVILVIGFVWYEQRPLSQSNNGHLVSTYTPQGWKVGEENNAVSYAIRSSDFATAPSTETRCADAGGEDCGPAMIKGAVFSFAYLPCYQESSAEFQKREADNVKILQGLVEQKPIVIAGLKGILAHTRNASKTINPIMIDAYSVDLMIAPETCKSIYFMYTESSTTNYKSELSKFLEGLRFEVNN